MYAKAIAAFITPVIVSVLMPLGITAETTLAQFIEILILAVATAGAVYFTRNRV